MDTTNWGELVSNEQLACGQTGQQKDSLAFGSNSVYFSRGFIVKCNS